ncbi:MAG: glycosyltransferase family 9 protein [Flavobacteriales bacterium]
MGKRILVIQTAFIGDVILATALLEQLHRMEPEAELTVLVRHGNQTLLTQHPFIHQVWTWDKHNGKYRSLFRMLKQIRAYQFDEVYNLQRFASTGFLTAFSKAKKRVGFDKNPLSIWFTHRAPHRISAPQDSIIIHEVDRILSLLNQSLTERVLPRLYPTAEDESLILPLTQSPFITISPGSVWKTKQVPVEVWSAFLENWKGSVYLLGAPSDAALCEQLAVNRPHVKVLAGKLTLLQSAALMRHAEMNYVNDSAPLHLSSAMNAPVSAAFCSTIPAFGFGPLASNARVIEAQPPPSCRPCGLHGKRQCPQGHFQCGLISTDQLQESLPSRIR